MQGKYILETESFDSISLADEMNKMNTVIIGDLWNIKKKNLCMAEYSHRASASFTSAQKKRFIFHSLTNY